MYRSFN